MYFVLPLWSFRSAELAITHRSFRLKDRDEATLREDLGKAALLRV